MVRFWDLNKHKAAKLITSWLLPTISYLQRIVGVCMGLPSLNIPLLNVYVSFCFDSNFLGSPGPSESCGNQMYCNPLNLWQARVPRFTKVWLRSARSPKIIEFAPGAFSTRAGHGCCCCPWKSRPAAQISLHGAQDCWMVDSVMLLSARRRLGIGSTVAPVQYMLEGFQNQLWKIEWKVLRPWAINI